jgi:hypothetical protein
LMAVYKGYDATDRVTRVGSKTAPLAIQFLRLHGYANERRCRISTSS